MFHIKQIIPLLIGVMLGSGAIWEYQNIELDKQQLKINLAEKTTQLRKELVFLMEDILKTNKDFEPLDLCAQKPDGSHNKAIKLHAKLNLYKQNYIAIEHKLAQLEGRQARETDLDFTLPCPPKIFHMPYK